MRQVLITIGLIVIDHLAKYFAKSLDGPIFLLGDFTKLTYTENTGIAFGLEIYMPLLIALNFLLLALLVKFFKQEFDTKKPLAYWPLLLILAGGVGNLLDRVLFGFVPDFISIGSFPVFNLADIYITVGVLLIFAFYGKIKRV